MFTEWNAFAKVDSTAQIILPANANFADTQTEVNYDQTSDSILGTLVYSYGGRQVGTANVVTTGAKITAYPFGEKSGTVSKNDNQTELSEKSAETGIFFWDTHFGKPCLRKHRHNSGKRMKNLRKEVGLPACNCRICCYNVT